MGASEAEKTQRKPQAWPSWQVAGGWAVKQGSTAMRALPISTKSPSQVPQTPQALTTNPTGSEPRVTRSVWHLPQQGLFTHLLEEGRGGGRDPGLTLQANVHGGRGRRG